MGVDPRAAEASSRKARRRGLRRSTSALTTTILGAVLSASTVSAQQSLPSATARRRYVGAAAAAANGPAERSRSRLSAWPPRGGRVTCSATASITSITKNTNAPSSYLREAEKRQVELSKTEKLKLKQAIDRAQRGLRESIGSERAYALPANPRPDRPRRGIVGPPPSPPRPPRTPPSRPRRPRPPVARATTRVSRSA